MDVAYSSLNVGSLAQSVVELYFGLGAVAAKMVLSFEIVIADRAKQKGILAHLAAELKIGVGAIVVEFIRLALIAEFVGHRDSVRGLPAEGVFVE